MSCRDILCVFESENGKLTPAFHQALALAISNKAHLTAISIARKVNPPGAGIGGSLVSGAISTANETLREQAETGANAAREAARISGIVHEIGVHQGMMADAAVWAGERARIADVTVLDRTTGPLQIQEALFEQALFTSGRPALIASPVKQSENIHKFCVAWNGTAVAARALGDALGLFPGVKKVDIVCILSKKGGAGRVPGADAAKHVARHGIEANVVDLPLGNNVATTIDGYARTSGADLIVMGGFGHSRLREFVLGGVTRELSASASLPLLLSH